MSFGTQARAIGRYLICSPIASGGMATVYLGRLHGLQGFTRTVAIKQLHPQFARDPEFVTMFLDEARLAARIHHPNVVAPLDVVSQKDEIFIVMEYVHGEALFRLLRLANEPIPTPIASSIMVQVLLGLHAAHEAADERGNALHIVHRDVSPQNILVGEDGVARIVDFGIAKAARRVHSTGDRKLKGKLGYMAPEQLKLEQIDRRADIFSAGVVLWEMLTGVRLFPYDEPAKVVAEMLAYEPQPISLSVPEISAALDDLILRALQPNSEQRFQTAREMAMALEASCPPAGVLEVAGWVLRTAGPALRQRAAWVADAESKTPSNLTIAKGLPPAGSTPAGGAALPNVAFIDSTQPFALDASSGALGPANADGARDSAVVEPKRRRPLMWMAFATAAAALLVGGIAALRESLTEEPASVIVLPANAPDPLPAGRPSPARIEPAPAPPASEARPSSPPTAASSDGGSSPRASAARRSPPAKVERRSARRPDCAVPYTVDAKGIKRFRNECF